MRKLSALALVLFACNALGESKDIAELQKKAEMGDLESQALLGSHFFIDLADGLAAQKQAVKWLSKAAEQGHAQSQYFLGRIFSAACPEKYFSKDDAEAVRWWRKAADSGYLDAFKALGESYFVGRGVPKDHKLACKWFRQAAEQGDHQSQHRLGDQYRHGQGVAKDWVKAHAWYELSTRCYPKYLRDKLDSRSPAEVDREVLAQKMTLEQTKKARKLAQALFKQIEANQTKKK